jgi:hypothetical protein
MHLHNIVAWRPEKRLLNIGLEGRDAPTYNDLEALKYDSEAKEALK